LVADVPATAKAHRPEFADSTIGERWGRVVRVVLVNQNLTGSADTRVDVTSIRAAGVPQDGRLERDGPRRGPSAAAEYCEDNADDELTPARHDT
jgi:hypothetical protein